MKRKDALKILGQVSTVYVSLYPGSVKATKESVRSLINSADWQGFTFTLTELLPGCAFLEREVK